MSKSQQRWPDKTIVGLTGNIATGKSTVMRMAKERGALTLDADQVVHEILDQDASMQAAIAVAFGSEVRLPGGHIDRKKLGAIVFNDPEALKDLEEMLHPAVRVEIVRQIDASSARLVFIEAIKLLEGALAEMCDQIWVTRCTRQRQLDRLVICRGLEAATAAGRIDVQPPQEAKVARADVVIDTNRTLADTEAQFKLAWSHLPDTEPIEEEAAPVSNGRSVEGPAPVERSRSTPPAATASAVTEELTPARSETAPTPQPATVRRARPSDIPAILLLIHRATDGAKKLKRADLLLALSERSYFIGQAGTEISTVMGWAAESMIGRIERIYVHPLGQTRVTGSTVLAEIEKSANELLCEIILAFPPNDSPPEIIGLLADAGYEPVRDQEQLKRAWKAAVAESRPENTLIMLKVLHDSRIA